MIPVPHTIPYSRCIFPAPALASSPFVRSRLNKCQGNLMPFILCYYMHYSLEVPNFQLFSRCVFAVFINP